MHGADQIADARDLMARHVIGEAVENFLPDERIDEVRGADLDGVRAGQDELERVGGIHDAAHPDDGNRHRLAALIHHPHRDRPDGRAAQSAHAVRELGLTGLDVDRHREERIDQ